MTPVTITSQHGFTGNRLKRKKGKEGRTYIELDGKIIELPDLEVKIDRLNRYVLLDEEAFIDETGESRRITEGFLFWG